MRRLKDYGFAAMVLAALTCAAWMATSVAVPRPIPDFALRAEEIYRLEVGTAFFLAFYLVAMAFVLALSGKGFAEFGTRGLKATDVVDQQQKTLLEQRNIDRHVQKQVREFRTTIDDFDEKLKSHEQRLEELKKKL